MATYSSPLYTNKTPAGGGHGPYQITQHIHATVSVPALATGDVINFGYIPPNAIIASVVLKAQSQLDSNGAPTLAFHTGVSGTPALFKNAITTVGRAAGASTDIGTGILAAGYLYKNTTGSKQLVTATASVGAATGVAGTLELDVEYYVEDTVGSPA